MPKLFAEQYHQAFPRSFTPVNNIALIYNWLGEFEKAADAAREAGKLEPKVVNPYAMLATADLGLGRVDEAKAVFQQAIRAGVDVPAIHNRLLVLAYWAEDLAEVKRQEDWLRPRIPEHPGTEAAADWNASHGRFRKADELYALARSETPKDRPGAIARLSIAPLAFPALLESHPGCPSASGPAIQKTLALYRGVYFLREAGLPLALCGDVARAQAVATEIHQAFPEGTLENGVDIPLIRAQSSSRAGIQRPRLTS